MNRIITILTAVLVLFVGYSCTPDEFELGDADVAPGELVEGIAFEIEHDASNPNIVYLTSKMDSRFTPLWDHPQGRSQDKKVTLKMAFPGTYEVKFGVQTRGGIVFGDATTFTIDDMYTDFISDPLWTYLSGGVGEEKTWYLDLDADALSRNFLGPLYFYGTDNGWLGNCMKEGGDCWNWNPDYKGNTWLMGAADFGSMTFDLKDGAHIKVVHNTISTRGTETGTYSMDAEAHTMRLVDASPLHDAGRDGVVVDWGNIKILSLTEDHMQLAVLRDPALSGEGACLLVYNFISKDYFDNWVPGEVDPPFTGNGNDALTTTSSKNWRLSTTTPYNWLNPDGSFIESLSAPADYLSKGFDYNQSFIEQISMTLKKSTESTGTYSITDWNSDKIEGTYSVDDKNNVKFDKLIDFTLSGDVRFATTEDKTLRIIKAETDVLGNVKGIWIGQRDPVEPKYLAYHFELADAAGAPGSPTTVPFDNTKLVFGDIEGNGKLRLELYNEFGTTKNNPPVDPNAIVVGERISVTFTLSGITLKAGAAGSYTTGFMLADADWSPQHWGGGPGEVQVTGNGTYTVWYEPESASVGAVVFVIDIGGLAADLESLSTVTATINSIKVL